MKICFVTDSYPPNIGGAELAIQKIAEGISNKNIEVLVITSNAKDYFPFHQNAASVKILRIKIPNFLRRFWFLVFSLPVVLTRCRDVDIIHGTSYGGLLQSFIAGKLLRKPRVATIHEFMGKKWNDFASNIVSAYLYRLFERVFAGLSFSKFIAVSSYTKKTLIEAGVDEKKIVVIHNGESDIDKYIIKTKSEIRNELKISDNKFVFASYGRTGLTKGFEFLIDAIPDVLVELKNSIFVLILSVGDIKIWNRVRKKILTLNPERVLFYPSMKREKMYNYLNASDSIIIPSISEGFGFTTLEACLLNKIIVASNVGSIPEVISGNHILVEPGSSSAITKGCIQAYNGNYSHTEARIFNWEATVNNYIKVYQEVLN